jgi:hypothetical protein
MPTPYPYRAKEFAVIERDGLYHIFYTRQAFSVHFDSTTRDLGHAVSSDLVTWTHVDSVLPVRPGEWDNAHIWAPSFVVTDSLIYMFYTGLTYAPPQFRMMQRIGVATSTDLVNWTRYPEPVLDCTDAPWTYCDPTLPAGGQFRDPVVIPHPVTAGHWLMLYGAGTEAATGQMMLGAAESSGNLFEWTDLGPLLNTAYSQTFSRLCESPAMTRAPDGTWYLFYTTDSGHPINYQTSTDPLGGPSAWSAQRRLFWEEPFTDDIFGPEIHERPGETWFGATNWVEYGAELHRLVFDEAPHLHFDTPYSLVAAPEAPAAPRGGVALRVESNGAAGVSFGLSLPLPGRAKLEVYDVAGRRVRALMEGSLPAGDSRAAWDLRDDGGRTVAPGVYLARLDTPFGSRATRVVRIAR